jgi:hypothetical protein
VKLKGFVFFLLVSTFRPAETHIFRIEMYVVCSVPNDCEGYAVAQVVEAAGSIPEGINGIFH